MGKGNSGRSTTGGPAVPYYRGSDIQEAAKHLRLTVTRFLADREPFATVEQAMSMLRDAVQAKRAGESPLTKALATLRPGKGVK